METILLASSGSFFTDKASEFLPKSLDNSKIAHITTASKGANNTEYLERRRKRFDELGWDVEAVDIEGMNEDSLLRKLQVKDVVFVEGGNTFYLLKCIRDSGFDRVMMKLIGAGVVYAGSSAGSYVACPTIEMALWKHQDKYNHYAITDLEAMNLVPFLVTAHYRHEYETAVKNGISKTKIPVRILTDEQAILIQDGEVKLVGNAKEVKL